MVEIIDPEGFTSLRDEEINSERSVITSALAGVVSGVTLAAEVKPLASAYWPATFWHLKAPKL